MPFWEGIPLSPKKPHPPLHTPTSTRTTTTHNRRHTSTNHTQVRSTGSTNTVATISPGLGWRVGSVGATVDVSVRILRPEIPYPPSVPPSPSLCRYLSMLSFLSSHRLPFSVTASATGAAVCTYFGARFNEHGDNKTETRPQHTECNITRRNATRQARARYAMARHYTRHCPISPHALLQRNAQSDTTQHNVMQHKSTQHQVKYHTTS